ncbi:hypothetical protein BDU57DRAFT_522852 [Ampelomyces quisqualis]|uniref:Uncharacterized protein n=1 Tax=Ampelomyces quisqualis TaxID=50730 RepID=A0A6A5QAV5_AMPQU|nr:hypothetical protein BDU57DRAFT_522852 [Ampelomyces quisqualis]
MAALSALTPSSYGSTSFDTQSSSPTSSTTSSSPSENIIWKYQRSCSIDSTTSSTTPDTPSRSDLDDCHHSGGYNLAQTPQTDSHQPNKTSMIIPSRPSTPEEYQFAADTAAFMRMVRGHLANVQDLKHQTGAPAVRFDLPDQPAQTKSRTSCRVFAEDEVRENVRRERDTRTWRKRFDPSETQRLCGEALAELEY